MYQFKKESTIILICILTIITFYCICWIFKMLNKIELELFSNSNSKRDKMKTIYKDYKDDFMCLNNSELNDSDSESEYENIDYEAFSKNHKIKVSSL